MAEYRHNSCSKCPPFARTHAKTPLVNCIVNDGLVNAMPNMQKSYFSSQHLFKIELSAIYK